MLGGGSGEAFGAFFLQEPIHPADGEEGAKAMVTRPIPVFRYRP